MTLADRVVVMNGGRIEQVGPPNELYHHPRTRFVAGFIGSPAMNFLPARLADRGGSLVVELGNDLSLPVPGSRATSYRPYAGRDIIFGLRPEHITERRSYLDGAEFTRPVDVLEPMGTETMVHLDIGGVDVCARCSPDIAAAPGQPMAFMAQMDHMHLIDPATDQVVAAERNKAAAA